MRRWPALRRRAVHVRRDIVPDGVLQGRYVRAGQRRQHVRQCRSNLLFLPGGRYLRGRSVQQLHVPERVLHGDDLQRAVCIDMRRRRGGVHGVRRDGCRRLLGGRGLHVRRAERVLGRTAVRRQPLRLRCDVVHGLLRRNDLQREQPFDVRSRRRHVLRLRPDAGRHVLRERHLSVRGRAVVQPGPALLERRVQVRRHVLPQRLLQRHHLHAAVAEHLRARRCGLRNLSRGDVRRMLVGGRVHLRRGTRVRHRSTMPERHVRLRRRLVRIRLLRRQQLPAREQRQCLRRRRQRVRELPQRRDL